MPSVSFSRLEPIVAGYFTLKNYAVFTDVPFRKANGRWSDIDVLAFNARELYIVECKRGALNREQVEKLVDHFKQAEEYLKKASPYKEFIEKFQLKIRKLYVAEYIRREKKTIEKHDIETKHAREILCEAISLVDDLLNKEKLEGVHPNQFIRYLVLLSKEKLLNTEKCKPKTQTRP